jgi:hypothetical protein
MFDVVRIVNVTRLDALLPYRLPKTRSRLHFMMSHQQIKSQ